MEVNWQCTQMKYIRIASIQPRNDIRIVEYEEVRRNGGFKVY
jgi:hypothetical protein